MVWLNRFLSQWGGGGILLVQINSTCLRCAWGGGGGGSALCAQESTALYIFLPAAGKNTKIHENIHALTEV
jgi:hypothetical protein